MRIHRGLIRAIAPVLLLLWLAATAAAADLDEISSGIEESTGHATRPSDQFFDQAERSLPPGFSLSEPLDEDDAVAIALWNNSALQATLAQVGLARADLIDARALINPQLQILAPVGIKPFELVLSAAIEALWQRPKRIASAKLTLESVSQSLVQNGIDLARDTRIAHADLLLAESRSSIAAESTSLRREIADLTQKLLDAGAGTGLEVRMAQVDALMAEDTSAQFEIEVQAARERLRLLMGLALDASWSVTAAPVSSDQPAEESEMLTLARAFRPDLRAAELAIEAAGRRVGWEHSRVLNYVTPILSSKEIGDNGVRTGPGVAVEVPILNRNQGGISRAEAEVRRATLEYMASVDRVESEVRSSRLRLVQALDSLRRMQADLLPSLAATAELAAKSYENGDISYLELQQARRPFLDAQLTAQNAIARVRQARAELARAIGRPL